MNKRIHVFYSGRVQGVGFRFTARALATKFSLKGWVKNLPNGKVELVCEGKEEDLHKALDSLDSEFSDYIRHKDIKWMAATGEFTNFEIRFF